MLVRNFRIFILFVLMVCAFSLSTANALSSRTCNPNVPKTIKYRPSSPICGGKAAIFLSGRYKRAFSVVFKKADHGDRLTNGCPLASCSPFKAQKTVSSNGSRVACFGESGFSPVFKGFDPDAGYNPAFVVKWISIKVTNSHQLQDVEIYCLPKPYPITPLN